MQSVSHFESASPPGTMKALQIMLPVVPSFSARVFFPYAIAAFARRAAQKGVSVPALLHGSDIAESDLVDPSVRVSYHQQRIVLDNALALMPEPSMPFDVGWAARFRTWGLLGMGADSAPTCREAAQFVAKYQAIVGPPVFNRTIEANGLISSVYDDAVLISDPLSREYAACIEMLFTGDYAVMLELFGTDFKLSHVTLMYPEPAHAHLYHETFGCPVLFGQPSNSLNYSDAWALNEPPLANPLTFAMVSTYCDIELDTIMKGGGPDAQVRQVLLAQSAPYPDLETVAAGLGMRPRTLRRKLDSSGTSFRELLADVRKQEAIRYLRETDLTQEEIASRLGFSDGANFRQAFRRWASMPPGAYRRMASLA